MSQNEETLAQMINGTIDPNWVLTLLVGVTAFLLIRILNRLEKKQDTHDGQINNHEVRITVLEKEKESI